MTVTNSNAAVTVPGTGLTTVFNYSFLIPSTDGSATDQTNCTLTYTDSSGNKTVLANNLWSITGIGTQAGGTFTYSPAIASMTTLTLARNLPYTQLTDLENQGAFNASSVMGMSDYVTMLVQQLNLAQQKSIQFPTVDSTSLNAILPAAAARANLILGFDANGNVQVSAGTTGPQGPSGSIPIVAAGGTADSITANYSPDLTLTDKTICAVVALGANTVINPTFAPDGLTAHTITKRGGGALLPGDIPAALAVIILEYNSANTRWELLNPATVQLPWAVASGTDTITATYIPAIAAVTDGLTLQFRASAANTSATPTFSPNSLIARTITKKGGSALVAGDIPGALAEMEVIYNSANTRWELLNPQSSNTNVINIVKIQKFIASGTYTPSTGMVNCWARLWSAGGGGGGVTSVSAVAAGGGGAGGYTEKIITAASIGASQVVTIATGGAGGANSGADGSAGSGASSLGAILSATSGAGGKGNTSASAGVIGGVGGVGSGGDINATGQSGGASITTNLAGAEASGFGGNTSLGGGGNSVSTSSGGVGKNAATNSGSGGSGAAAVTTASVGGNGADGLLVIIEYCSQ